jgi:Domain of unknown function (DUF2610)
MKKFSVNCDFGGQIAPFSIYIGSPEGGHHPLHFQADWLAKQRGGSIPPATMESIGRLKELASKNNVSLEDLCTYALGAAQQEKDEQENLTASNPEHAGKASASDQVANEIINESHEEELLEAGDNEPAEDSVITLSKKKKTSKPQ